ncbi:LysE family translocator [Pseudomonas oryzihabitans]|uniref:LysE family translocator n=1 Tax=Pseudomonas oryzihabitans TaxID=47885 RepID=UPI002159970B|nr:LysE family transporter [Pseudomonas psychrotolerans]
MLGAFYLGWLGLSRLRQSSPPGQWTGKTRPAIGVARRLRQGLLVSLTNPKLIIFFLALFPPFIQADRRCCRSWCC